MEKRDWNSERNSERKSKMPLPNPRKDEKKEDFVARFIQSRAAEEFATSQQKLAVAFSQWREKYPEDKKEKGK